MMVRREDLEIIEGVEVHLLESGQIISTHPFNKCSGNTCAIHNPSNHTMKNLPRLWRDDRGLMERICKHGVGHPDPDHIEHVNRTRGNQAAQSEGIHGCTMECVNECH